MVHEAHRIKKIWIRVCMMETTIYKFRFSFSKYKMKLSVATVRVFNIKCIMRLLAVIH